jgi:hypothetical protein
MDGAQEVERKRAAQAVSAKVDTGARECVSFGEPVENTLGGATREFSQDSRWTNEE